MDNALKNILALGSTQFGRTVRYKNKGKQFQVTGIFDEPYQGVNIGEVEFASAAPIFTLPTSTLPCKPVIGDVLFFDNEAYTVRNFRADGTGMTVMQLEIATNLEIATVNNLLLQDGFNMLLETGGFILLEVNN